MSDVRSRVGDLVEALRSGSVIFPDGSALPWPIAFVDRLPVFVVDFATAGFLVDSIQKSVDIDGKPPEFRLPYDSCLFEFVNLSAGRNAVRLFAVSLKTYEDDTLAVVLFQSIASGNNAALWSCFSSNELKPPDGQLSFIFNYIMAACAAMEAGAAATQMIRAPLALNKKRERNGKAPLKDFHIVELAKRHRADPAPGGGTHASPRLHFRRGHWRHFASHRTWIKWQLVGNPELGFVDKSYRI